MGRSWTACVLSPAGELLEVLLVPPLGFGQMIGLEFWAVNRCKVERFCTAWTGVLSYLSHCIRAIQHGQVWCHWFRVIQHGQVWCPTLLHQGWTAWTGVLSLIQGCTAWTGVLSCVTDSGLYSMNRCTVLSLIQGCTARTGPVLLNRGCTAWTSPVSLIQGCTAWTGPVSLIQGWPKIWNKSDC